MRARFSLALLGGLVAFVTLQAAIYYLFMRPVDPKIDIYKVETPTEHIKTITRTVTKTVAALPAPAASTDTTGRPANATFVMLARNSDIDGALGAIRSIQDRFNVRHDYPFVFLNDEEFSEDFKRRMQVVTGSNAQFGLIPEEHWNQPDWIDEEKAKKGRTMLAAANVKYADSVPYRNMCRFNSGFFFKHDLLQPYRYYWRIEPHVKFHCDIHLDPFLFMQENNKTYGFTIAAFDIQSSIRTLWKAVTGFMDQHPEHIANRNSIEFLSDNHGKTYNRCHFWSNFEIADMDFWRGEAYTAFFEHLDKQGGFYYERWGDAPVHSIAAGLFLDRHQIHFFDEIGYQHDDWTHCPSSDDVWIQGRCTCNKDKSFDYENGSCKSKWDSLLWM